MILIQGGERTKLHIEGEGRELIGRKAHTVLILHDDFADCGTGRLFAPNQSVALDDEIT